MRLAAIAADYEAAIRYATERGDSIHGGPRAHEPIGFSVPGTEITKEWPRAIASEKLYDLGRESEAEKTLWHDGDLALDAQGKIRRGVFSTQPINDAWRRVEAHIDDWSNGDHRHPYVTVNDPDHLAALADEPTPPGHSLVSHVDADEFRDPNPDAEIEHEDVPDHKLGSHIANVIDRYVDEQHGMYWPVDMIGDHAHEVMMDQGHNNDLRELIHGVERQYPSLRSWARLGEGGTGDAETAIHELDAMISRLEAAYPGDDEESQSEHNTQLVNAQRIRDHFYDLRDEPERREKENRAEYKRLLAELRKIKPIVADPTDTD